MDFVLSELLDQQACYDSLVARLYPCGLACTNCGGNRGLGVQRDRASVLDYQCPRCGAVFNAFTNTTLTSRSPSEVVLALRGIAKSTPTLQLARELGWSHLHLLELCRGRGFLSIDRPPTLAALSTPHRQDLKSLLNHKFQMFEHVSFVAM